MGVELVAAFLFNSRSEGGARPPPRSRGARRQKARSNLKHRCRPKIGASPIMARIERSPSAMLLHHGIVARTSNSVQAEPAVFGRSSSSAALLGPGFGSANTHPSVSRLVPREERLDAMGLRPRFGETEACAPPIGVYDPYEPPTVWRRGAALAGNVRSASAFGVSLARSSSRSSLSHAPSLYETPPSTPLLGRSTSCSTWMSGGPAGWHPRVNHGLVSTDHPPIRGGAGNSALTPPPLPRFASTVPYDRDTAELKGRLGLPRGISIGCLPNIEPAVSAAARWEKAPGGRRSHTQS